MDNSQQQFIAVSSSQANEKADEEYSEIEEDTQKRLRETDKSNLSKGSAGRTQMKVAAGRRPSDNDRIDSLNQRVLESKTSNR